MQKILLNITERQKQTLKAKAEELSISVSEYVRRILDLNITEPVHKILFMAGDKSAEIEVTDTFIETAKKYPDIFQIKKI